MKTYTVYHCTNEESLIRLWTSRATMPTTIKREGYTQVATVTAESLDEAYRLTNSIDEPWQHNPSVTPARPDTPERSTSIGDVIVEHSQIWIDPEHPSKQAVTCSWIVARIGFSPVQFTTDEGEQ
jgi:hypothetical protein